MKKIKTLLYVALMSVMMLFSSCKDWLTLMPLNDVVLENFWTEKADVESVLLGTYAALESNDCIVRMSMWGEMRSDNIVANTSAPNDIIQITKDNILETNSYTSWRCFYDVINKANTVLHFAPIVAEKDPNYTVAELNANIAEATALRVLSYWYLIRAYKDVPYVTRPSIDDTEEFLVPAEKFDVILQYLIDDLESVKKYAVNKYVLDEANTARFTRVGIEAILADLYLWQGNWDKCIETVDNILERKMVEYKEILEDDPTGCTVELIKDRYPMITDVVSNISGNAYNEIFGQGNSFETLFELSFMPNSGSPNFSFVREYYSESESDLGNLEVETRVGSGFEQGTNAIFESKYDGRYYETIVDNSGQYSIAKYAMQSIQFKLNTGDIQDDVRNYRSQNAESTWIIYRLTDVMLMQAEAKTMKAMEMGTDLTGDTLAARDQLLEEAFFTVQSVNWRAKGRNVFTQPDSISIAPYRGNARQMEELILKERRRELLYEGKRWFDLVRMARRDGDTKRLSQMVLLKYTENVSAVRIKLADMDAIYFPISKDELKINTLLKQNPAYEEDEFIEKAD